MSMSTIQEDEELSLVEQEQIAVLVPSAAGALNKSEVECQLDAAHKYARSVKRFLTEAVTLATLNQEVAESCIYSLPRGGKVIAGPSIRLAEICASAYGNLHIGARVVGIEDKEIVAQGIAWDLEKNLRVSVESRRRITNKNGSRFNDDMITMTGNAAASIGLRNAIFRVIPRAYVNAVYQKAREVAVGSASTLSAKRQTVVDRLVKMGAMPDRILARIGKPSVEDINLNDLEILIGLGTAIRDGNLNADEAFPANAPPDKGKVNMDDLRPGKEENRGHGNENLASAAGNSAQGGPEAVKGAGSAPPDAAEECTVEDFVEIEKAANAAKVSTKAVADHVKNTMGFEKFGQLTKARKGEVLAWIEKQKR
jgi:hypothetical protein